MVRKAEVGGEDKDKREGRIIERRVDEKNEKWKGGGKKEGNRKEAIGN